MTFSNRDQYPLSMKSIIQSFDETSPIVTTYNSVMVGADGVCEPMDMITTRHNNQASDYLKWQARYFY